MKSTVKFDLNGQDESVINATIIQTDDVRDKVARRFKDALGYNSNLAVIRIKSQPESNKGPYSETNLEIRSYSASPTDTIALCRELPPEQLQMLYAVIPHIIPKEMPAISQENQQILAATLLDPERK